MSFENDYPNRKDWRKPYHGSKAVDATCRPGGDCPYCNRGRQHKHKRQLAATELDMRGDQPK